MHRATPFSTSLRSYTAGGARSVVDSVDDSKLMQEAKGNFAKGETRDSIESPQNYGFTSVCADGEKDKDGNLTMGPETFVSFPGGNRSFPAYGAMDDRRHRLKNLGKDAAKGSTAIFGLKEWGQQFLNTDTGMFMTGNNEKKMRFQLVENQNGKKEQEQPRSGGGSSGGSAGAGAASAAALFEPALPEPRRFRSESGVEFEVEVFQAPQVTPFADGGGGGSSGGGGGGSSSGGSNGGQQEGGKSKPTGQKTLHKEKSDTYVDMTKDAVHTVRGKGNIKATDSNTHTYHEDEKTSTRCDDGHVHIRKGAAKIWVSKGGCHSTVPITIVDCKDDGKGELQWTEGANPSAPSEPTPSGVEFIYPPPDRVVTPYDVTSVSPPLSESGGNVTMAYAAPIALGTGTTPPLTLKYVAPLMLDASGNLTVDPAAIGGGGDLSDYALLDSPVFIGDPRAPTPATVDNDTSIATTAFVKAQGYLVAADIAGKANLASPTFTGDPKAPTPATADNDTSIATTAFVKAQGYEAVANKGIANGYASLDASAKVPAAQLPSYVDDVVEYANLAAFPATGTVGVIYVALDTGKIYRWSGSAYVEISPSPGSTDSVPEGSVNLYYTEARVSANATVASKAPIASPIFTGDPRSVTPATSDNDTSIATTAFVKAQGYAVSSDLGTMATQNANAVAITGGTIDGVTLDGGAF